LFQFKKAIFAQWEFLYLNSTFQHTTMSTTNPQSWYDMPFLAPMDPRAIISQISFTDNGGGSRAGQFLNSATFLNNTTWQPSPLSITPLATATPFCLALTPQDFVAVQTAAQWTNSHGIVRSNTQLPPTVQKILFLKAGIGYITTFFLDWVGGVTSTDIQISPRDNSATAGNFLDAAAGNVPVFSWTGNTFGGTGKQLSVVTTGPGRVNMAMRVIDNSANWSMFEMDWNIVS
jgi:hypothetical protein